MWPAVPGVPPLVGGSACSGGWLVVGWLAVLVVPVVSGVGVVPLAVFGSVVVGVAPAVVEGVDAVGGWVVVPLLPVSVVLVTLLVRAPPAELQVLVPPVMPMVRALRVMPWWMAVF